MVPCTRQQFETRCNQFGYPVAKAMACVTSCAGDLWLIDPNHPEFPKCPRAGFVPREFESLGIFDFCAPGTELSKLLKRFGIEPTPTCACRAKAAEMDAWGCDECSKPERIEEVVAVMREEAKARGLPFLDAVGRMLVRRAIHNARKASPPPARAETPIV